MQLKNILLGVAFTGLNFAAYPNLVNAQTCHQKEVVAPTNQTRTIRQQQLGYQFNIPNNYRAMAVKGNAILILDPNNFTLTQCLIKNKAPREYPPNISIDTTPVNDQNRTLTEIIKENHHTADKFSNTKVANETAIIYTSNTLGEEQTVAFFSPNRKYIITISAPYNFNQGKPTSIFNKAVFEQVVSSFTFIN
ncbi:MULTISPECIES: hypothetical protein [unclassified Tolypothrix]|uniref:hypothetical protein n=1 Tax=unclassified Tolypothrix TaxID=2649714 RepID=UPI0005EABDEE|nr:MULTISPECIES: hypothetical protein [unclassified Tolypothrix]BAY94682.1 hypothetical protein NIES3275_67340 [Microchaete diplosiphon NIES-3275]EKE99089.1 hypothetical protein FDUTEX481_03281 [Tolypothrix sp. PCC 7601]MBE9085109.1 hypothetical protein [Tolypothrix sp. LEGE 11397]UYD28375.1 hypothetical protein HGR01_10235 [Tolypothrix sp. PCC 7712]UYD35747.1 hypothetical protein HG267_08330 [Tolypothrix sp. PCC 7601]